MSSFIPKYSAEIQQMMFVAGETQSIPLETVTVVEKIIRDQIIRMLTTANDLAARRGDKMISVLDIIFQIRHDPKRVRRLQKLLNHKAMIKQARKASDDDADLDDVEDVVEDALNSPAAEEASHKNSEPTTTLMPWDVEFFFSVQPPGGDADDDLANEETLERLRWADEMTKRMTTEEYVKYTECRKVSFTKRKEKRFRDWIGLDVTAGLKKKSETLEIISFLAVEMVRRLTDIALSIQQRELNVKRGGDRNGKQGLFVVPNPERPALGVGHIREAFEKTQISKRRRYRLNNCVQKKHLELI